MPVANCLIDLFNRLDHSTFRRNITLNEHDYSYFQQKGELIITQHATDFIAKRLAPAHLPNDGKQTPWKGHPVFVAQHATATCCRSCLEKWHGILQGRDLTEKQQQYIICVIMKWLALGKLKIRKNTSRNLSLL